MSQGDSHLAGAPVDEMLVEGSDARHRLLQLSDSGGSDRKRALLVDPGLAVRHAAQDDEFSTDDVEELKRALERARRVRKVESATERSNSSLLAAMAVLLMLALLVALPPGLENGGDQGQKPMDAGLRVAPTAITHSGFEAVGLPGARVYELADESFSLVVIVDESFEL